MTSSLLSVDVSPELIAEIESAGPTCMFVGVIDCVFPARYLVIYTCPTCDQLGCVYVCILHRFRLNRARLVCGACDTVIPRDVKLKIEKL